MTPQTTMRSEWLRLGNQLTYLLRSGRKLVWREGLICPSCGSSRHDVVERKYLVTALRRCRDCELLFRTPTSTAAEDYSFYQSRYSQGLTTSMPTRAELNDLLERRFRGTEKDYSTYLAVLAALGAEPGDRVLDFGCSWGYGSWQLTDAGYKVVAYEISESRCRYAREELGVDARTNLDQRLDPVDVFFSAHVLEHVPSVGQVIDLARRVVKPGGWFVAFTPNGSNQARQTHGAIWSKWWGLVHPNFLDDRFYRRAFPSERCLLVSDPYDAAGIREWASSAGESASGTLSGYELLIAAQLNSVNSSTLAVRGDLVRA
jgi:SAM-dependent methyltransferase